VLGARGCGDGKEHVGTEGVERGAGFGEEGDVVGGFG